MDSLRSTSQGVGQLAASAVLPRERGEAVVPPKRAKGLVNEVVEQVAAQIRRGDIKPATKLPSESVIMSQMGVSRTVVREAISRLQASGLVETRHGIGTFALSVPSSTNFQIAAVDFATIEDVIHLLELRISLETEAAGLAAQRRTEAHLQAMRGHLMAFEHSMAEVSTAVPSDFAFHLEVAKATGNRHFAGLMDYLGAMIIPRTRVNTASAAPEGRLAYLERVHAEHLGIFNAIRNQDSQAARASMRMHLSNSKDRLKEAQSRQA
jgi:GntR family transcriptional regulator, transcriptional repressor for pyruvate dehydrogenase complex